METKKWYQSKVIWAGILTAAASSATILAEILQQSDISVQSVIGAVLGIFTIWARVNTSTEIDRE